MKGVVYFVSSEDGKYTKIGMTKNMDARFRALQTSSPMKLNIVATIPTNHPRKLESELHAEYASHRLEGEWFDIPPEMAKSIAQAYGGGLNAYESSEDIMNAIAYFRERLERIAAAPMEQQNPADFYTYEEVDLFMQSLKKFKEEIWTDRQPTVYEAGRILNGALFLLLQQNAWGDPEVVMQDEAKKLLNFIKVVESHVSVWFDHEEEYADVLGL